MQHDRRKEVGLEIQQSVGDDKVRVIGTAEEIEAANSEKIRRRHAHGD